VAAVTTSTDRRESTSRVPQAYGHTTYPIESDAQA
jgi:hypothetical protein